MDESKKEFCPIKNESIADIQNSFSKAISDLTKSTYFCKILKIEYDEWNKVNISIELDGSDDVIKNIVNSDEKLK